MKRTTVMLDADLLEEARRELGTRTYSETLNLSMQEAIRRKRILGLRQFFGSGIWQGDLNEMRQDRFPDWGVEKSKAKRARGGRG